MDLREVGCDPRDRIRTLDKYTREGSPEICCQQNFRATARDHSGQNKGHTSSPRIEIKSLT